MIVYTFPDSSPAFVLHLRASLSVYILSARIFVLKPHRNTKYSQEHEKVLKCENGLLSPRTTDKHTGGEKNPGIC